MSPLDAALEAIDRCIPVPEDGTRRKESLDLIRSKVRGLMVGYANRWGDLDWETLEVEHEFHLPIVNPKTGASSRTFTHAGKYDGIVTWPASGKRMLLEHKTTSDDIAPNAPYWRRLTIDSQVSHYMLANWQEGEKLDGTLYDVIRKPTIRPKKLEKAERARLANLGEYYGRDVPDEFRLEERENAFLFERRLIADIEERPEFYFGRQTVNRIDAELHEFANELWDVGQTMLDARNNERNYRNDASCMAYGSPCEYLGICSGHDSPDSDKWKRTDNVHEELNVEDGRSVLTHSRLKCFQTCRRKHFFRYELGLRRHDEEDREALFFGSVMHEALAAYWLCFKKGSNHVHGNAAIAAAETAGLVGVHQDVGQ